MTTQEKERAPYKRLAGNAGKWFASLAAQKNLGDDDEKLAAHLRLHQPLLEALGYSLKPDQIELQKGTPSSCVGGANEPTAKPPLLSLFPRISPGREDDDTLNQKLTPGPITTAWMFRPPKPLTWLDLSTGSFRSLLCSEKSF